MLLTENIIQFTNISDKMWTQIYDQDVDHNSVVYLQNRVRLLPIVKQILRIPVINAFQNSFDAAGSATLPTAQSLLRPASKKTNTSTPVLRESLGHSKRTSHL